MSKAAVVRGRGRPEGFNAAQIQAIKKIVRTHGLIHGREIINQNGITVFGKHQDVSISLPTLSKYVKRDEFGGKSVELKRGRPVKVA